MEDDRKFFIKIFKAYQTLCCNKFKVTEARVLNNAIKFLEQNEQKKEEKAKEIQSIQERGPEPE